MAIVTPSIGYPGTIAPGTTWANMQWGLGTRYFVYHQDNVRVTPVAGGTRQVSISAGYFGGWGILDQNDAPVTVSLPTVASGTKWFLIVARRTWQTTNATTFTYIDCGTSPVYPGTRNTSPGVIDDQPLAFVPLAAGSTVPGTPRDVRVMGTSPENQIINDDLALGYMAYLGVRLRLGTTQYVRGLNAAGNPVWQIENGAYGRDAITEATSSWGSSMAGWTTAGVVSRAIRYGNVVELNLRSRKMSGDLVVGSAGGVVDTPIFTVSDAWKPSNTVQASCSYINPGLGNSQGLVSLDSDGVIKFTAGTPGQNVKAMPSGSWSIQTNFTFIQTGA